MKKIWRTTPIAYKIFLLILLFISGVEIIAAIFVWNFESKVLLQKEKQNLTKELNSHKTILLSYLSFLEKESNFLAKLEVMDDIIAKDIDKRIITLLERKAHDLGNDISIIVTDQNNKIVIANKKLLSSSLEKLKQNNLIFQSKIYTTFNPKKNIGKLILLYPLKNLTNLKITNPHKKLWLIPPKDIEGFTKLNIKDDIVIHHKLSTILENWELYISYDKEAALSTLTNIEKIQFYTFLIATILLGIIIFFLSKYLTMPLMNLLQNSEKALEAKSTFLSTISHELRTPLGSILNLTQHLIISPKIDSEELKMLSAIETSSQHLLSMINNILQLSKLESNTIIVHKEKIDLKDIIEEIFEIIEPLILDKDIIFEKSITIQNREIITDSNLLKQVIINLLSNAIKFTNRGKISIKLLQNGEYYLFEVKDTGIGIDIQRQKQLFQPFFQADIDIQNLKNSSGLGLALSQKVARLLNGDIQIISQGEGEGTTAIFRFKSI